MISHFIFSICPVGLTGKYKLSSTDARLVCCCSCWFLPSLLLNFVLRSTVVFGVCVCVKVYHGCQSVDSDKSV